MGLGLGGAKRLSNEFEIESQPGRGTRVSDPEMERPVKSAGIHIPH
jgi:anti-sigma regulatory factor (Ser/Thr protein kinase)